MSNKNHWLSFELSKKNRTIINETNTKINNIFESLDVMDYNLIHMTSVFLGKSLQGKNKNILIKANNIINNSIKELNNINVILTFDRFDYLPFDKKYKKLLVAIYNENIKLKSWNCCLRKELNKLGICNYITDNFMPHITIGKVKHIYPINELNKYSYPNIHIKNMYLDGIRHKYILQSL
jgi:2'-5' RNA ligase